MKPITSWVLMEKESGKVLLMACDRTPLLFNSEEGALDFPIRNDLPIHVPIKVIVTEAPK